jgi:hypothetical protein
VLVAFEDLYRTYRETIAAAIQVLRPHVEVTISSLDDLEAELARLDTRVVISSQDRPASLRPGVTWVQVPLEVGPRTQVTLDTLLEAIDGVEKPRPPSKRLTTKRTTKRNSSG